MRWEICKLIGRVQTGKDALNNPTYKKSVICHFKGRLSPWSVEDISNLGREYTSTHRKLITILTTLAIEGNWIDWNSFNFESGELKEYENTSISVNGVEYQIDRMTDFTPRYRLLYVSAYKQ